MCLEQSENFRNFQLGLASCERRVMTAIDAKSYELPGSSVLWNSLAIEHTYFTVTVAWSWPWP